MRNNYNQFLLWFIAVIVLFSISSCRKSDRIAFVNSDELVSNYEGMIEAKNLFALKKTSWQRSIDSLTVSLNSIEAKADSLNQFGKKIESNYLKMEALLRLRKSTMDHMVRTQGLIDEEDLKLTDGVLMQINEHINAFAKANEYSMIFSSMDGNSILYGKDSNDVTKDLLDYMNSRY